MLGTTLDNNRGWRNDMVKLLDEVQAGTRKLLVGSSEHTQSFGSALLLLANVSPWAIRYITLAIDALKHLDTHAADDAHRLLHSHALTHKCTTLAPGLPCFLQAVVIVARFQATASHCNPADVDVMDRATPEQEVTRYFNLDVGHTADVRKLPYGAHILYDKISTVVGSGLQLLECFRALRYITPADDPRLWVGVSKERPHVEMIPFGAHMIATSAHGREVYRTASFADQATGKSQTATSAPYCCMLGTSLLDRPLSSK